MIDCRTPLAFFTLSYDSINVDDPFPNLNPFRELVDVQNFHNFFTKSWSVLLKAKFHYPSGFTATLAEGHKYLLPHMISSYIANIPEADDNFSLKWEGITSIPH